MASLKTVAVSLSQLPIYIHALVGGIVSGLLVLAPHVDTHVSRGDWISVVLAFLSGAGLTSYQPATARLKARQAADKA